MSRNIFLFAILLICSLIVSQNQILNLVDSTPIHMGDTTFSDVLKDAHIEVLNINGSGTFTKERVNVGDTLSYIITVEWENPKIPITVFAPESLTFTGMRKIKASTSHKKNCQVCRRSICH